MIYFRTTGLKFIKNVGRQCYRHFSVSSRIQNKVAILGAAGGVGQPLSLLLKQNPRVSQMALYDITNTAGVAADLSHISTKAKVTSHEGDGELREALQGSDVVIITAGIIKPKDTVNNTLRGMTRDDLFNTNAPMVHELSTACAKYCPKAMICLVTNPVNSLIPITSEVFKQHGVYDPKKIFGVTKVDVTRARTFIAEAKGLDVNQVHCPVVGGHDHTTIVPLISQCTPPVSFPMEERKALTARIQTAAFEIVDAKDWKGSVTLSMAYAGARFTSSLLNALAGESGVVDCALVYSEDYDTRYFATPLQLGPSGVEKSLGLGQLIDYEVDLIKAAVPELRASVKKGEDYILKVT